MTIQRDDELAAVSAISRHSLAREDHPFYLEVANEVAVFEAAFRGGLPIM